MWMSFFSGTVSPPPFSSAMAVRLLHSGFGAPLSVETLWRSYGLASVQDLRSLYSSEQEVYLDLTSQGVPDQEARTGCLVWRDSLRAVACDRQVVASVGPSLVLPALCGKEPLPSKEPLPRKVRAKAQSFRASAQRPAVNALGAWRLQRAEHPKRQKVQGPAQSGTEQLHAAWGLF